MVHFPSMRVSRSDRRFGGLRGRSPCVKMNNKSVQLMIAIMNTIDIDTFITINPKEIGSDLDTLVLQKLKDTYVNKCIKKYGYIFDILDYKYDKSIITSRVNENMFVKCLVTILSVTPKVGEIYYGTVKIIYPQGIFVSLINIFDTLVPFDCLKRANYTFTGTSFTNQQHTISQGCVLNVKVTAISYDKKNFNCIADIVDIQDVRAINVVTKEMIQMQTEVDEEGTESDEEANVDEG